ncbi:MAG: site-specific DNA-methyltransferase [Anaerolineaceae bacterium]|nr:site-specific DNA-methyltransferase [Anaerolineaceae bacterium]
MEINKIFVRDARELQVIFKDRKAPFVDTTITSPPYWDQKNYDDVSDQIGYNQSKSEYFRDIEKILYNCFDFTKTTGSLWLIVDTFRRQGIVELLPFEVSEIATRIGWRLRDIIIWDKHHGLPWHQKGQMRDVSEFILFFTKSDNYKFYVDRIKTIDEISKWWVDFPERYNPKGKTPTNIWRYQFRRRGTWPKPSVVDHLCPLPTGLAARIIELSTDEGDLVFDPFAGSGVALATAEVMGRKYLGVEINKKYTEMFNISVRKEVHKEWEEITRERKKYQNSMGNFEQTVMKLRVLKYTRKLVNSLMTFVGNEAKGEIYCCLMRSSIPLEYSRSEKLQVNLQLVGYFPDCEMESILKFSKDSMERAPLSNYSIDGKVEITDLLNSGNIIKEDQEEIFYMYSLNKIRKFDKMDTLKNWVKTFQVEKIQKNLIPILSNVSVDISWVDNN